MPLVFMFRPPPIPATPSDISAYHIAYLITLTAEGAHPNSAKRKNRLSLLQSPYQGISQVHRLDRWRANVLLAFGLLFLLRRTQNQPLGMRVPFWVHYHLDLLEKWGGWRNL